MTLLLLKLFWTFFVIGMFTVGGGYAVMGIIQSEVVVAKGWITEATFTDIVAVSQMTPGPVGLNCATYVGYEVLNAAGAGQFASSLGSLTATLAIVLPSFIIMLGIVKFYTRFHENSLFKGVMNSLKPCVAGLIAAAAFVLIIRMNLGGAAPAISVMTDNFPDWKSWILLATSFVAYTVFRQGPLEILAGGAVLGILLY